MAKQSVVNLYPSNYILNFRLVYCLKSLLFIIEFSDYVIWYFFKHWNMFQTIYRFPRRLRRLISETTTLVLPIALIT